MLDGQIILNLSHKREFPRSKACHAAFTPVWSPSGLMGSPESLVDVKQSGAQVKMSNLFGDPLELKS